MKTKVSVYSERKGSNPGGNCSITIPHGGTIDAYIKYCLGSRLPKNSPFGDRDQPFRATAQPIYEALTLVLARKMGLLVPEFYVLDNSQVGREVEFEYSPNGERLNESMPYFFVSKLIVPTKVEEPTAKEAALKREKLYRDLLVVSDVSNKAQNYMYAPDLDRMVYLDLGCSFVNAVGGTLLPHTGKQEVPSKRVWRRIQRKIDNYLLEDIDGGTTRLSDLVDISPDTKVPMLNPRCSRSLGDLLNPEEIEETSLIIKANLVNIWKKHKRDPRLCSMMGVSNNT
jgi:hypothetical protein